MKVISHFGVLFVLVTIFSGVYILGFQLYWIEFILYKIGGYSMVNYADWFGWLLWVFPLFVSYLLKNKLSEGCRLLLPLLFLMVCFSSNIILALVLAIGAFLCVCRINDTSLVTKPLILLGGLIMVTFCTRTEDISHYEYKAMHYLNNGDYSKVLNVGKKSEVYSERLFSFRMAALNAEKRLGKDMFSYQVYPTSTLCLPMEDTSNIFVPKNCLEKMGIVSSNLSMSNDYQLADALIKKQLHSFVKLLMKTYNLNKPLPRNYAEAVILYLHLHGTSVINYKDQVVETDYQDYRQFVSNYARGSKEQKNYTCRNYGNTYWYYYHFVK